MYSISLFTPLDNDVLETSKRRAMFYNILSQNYIVINYVISVKI